MKRTKRMFLLARALFGVVFLASYGLSTELSTAEAAKARLQASRSQLVAPKDQITVLYDAFGRDSSMKKDWGCSAVVKVGGKRILFNTDNNSEIFAHNVRAKGVDLSKLDIVVMSHRHDDHMGGLNYLLPVNPNVAIYAQNEHLAPFCMCTLHKSLDLPLATLRQSCAPLTGNQRPYEMPENMTCVTHA